VDGSCGGSFNNEHTVEIGSLRIKPSTERRPQHHRNSYAIGCDQ
jgi:hypothetical protein